MKSYSFRGLRDRARWAGRLTSRSQYRTRRASKPLSFFVLHESGFQQSRSPSSPFREFKLPVLKNQRTQHSSARLEHQTASRRYQRGRLTIIFCADTYRIEMVAIYSRINQPHNYGPGHSHILSSQNACSGMSPEATGQTASVIHMPSNSPSRCWLKRNAKITSSPLPVLIFTI